MEPFVYEPAPNDEDGIRGRLNIEEFEVCTSRVEHPYHDDPERVLDDCEIKFDRVWEALRGYEHERWFWARAAHEEQYEKDRIVEAIQTFHSDIVEEETEDPHDIWMDYQDPNSWEEEF